MKKRTVNSGIIGMILAAICALVVVFNLTDITVHGAMSNNGIVSDEHMGAEVDNYDLIIIEEEQLPAAKAPTESKASKAGWVIAIVSVIVALIGYELWFENCNLRIKTLAVESGEEDFLKGIGRLHPLKAMDARRELESRTVENYFK